MTRYIIFALFCFICNKVSAQDLWITGSAVPGGAQKLEKVADNDYKYAGRLNAGELRITTAKKPRKGTRFFSPMLLMPIW